MWWTRAARRRALGTDSTRFCEPAVRTNPGANESRGLDGARRRAPGNPSPGSGGRWLERHCSHRSKTLASRTAIRRSSPVAAVPFTGLPSFYQTRWFALACVLGVLGILGLAYQRRLQAIAREVRARRGTSGRTHSNRARTSRYVASGCTGSAIDPARSHPEDSSE